MSGLASRFIKYLAQKTFPSRPHKRVIIIGVIKVEAVVIGIVVAEAAVVDLSILIHFKNISN